VRTSVPAHVRPTPEYLRFLNELKANPAVAEVLKPGMAFDPEQVFFIDYLADEAGWAHSLQVHPDGTSDYIAHKPAELEKGVRWISRTPDQDCLGIVLPSTAEPEGYTAEKAKGNIKVLGAGATYKCVMEAGVLTEGETAVMQKKIAGVLAKA
jgi:hypothetical protein